MNDRGTGRTTRQMKEAPQGATFFWCNNHAAYARDLALACGRGDLRIQPASNFSRERIAGLRKDMVIIDHALLEALPTLSRGDERQARGAFQYLAEMHP